MLKNITTVILLFIINISSLSIPAEKSLNQYLLKTSSPNGLQFNFRPWKLAQGCDAGDLPFYFYLHPDDKTTIASDNPGIATYKDFIIWAGMNFDEEFYFTNNSTRKILKSYGKFRRVPFGKTHAFTISERIGINSQEYEKKGLQYVKKNAERGDLSYITILSGYYFYSGKTRQGLYWAEKGAENGEIGSMDILGDAYYYGYGVIQDDVEGLKWYIIASSLGNLKATGMVLSTSKIADDSPENLERLSHAYKKAKEWMATHKKLFISDAT